MEKLFRGTSGRCTRFARMAVRLGFHDAGTWSKATESQGGGADGSICLTNEISRPENNGLQDIVKQMQAWYKKWHDQEKFPITMADLIQMVSGKYFPSPRPKHWPVPVYSGYSSLMNAKTLFVGCQCCYSCLPARPSGTNVRRSDRQHSTESGRTSPEPV